MLYYIIEKYVNTLFSCMQYNTFEQYCHIFIMFHRMFHRMFHKGGDCRCFTDWFGEPDIKYVILCYKVRNTMISDNRPVSCIFELYDILLFRID